MKPLLTPRSQPVPWSIRTSSGSVVTGSVVAPGAECGRRRVLAGIGSLGLVGLFANCKKRSAESAEKAKSDVAFLARAVASDVKEVRSGLPVGAGHMQEFFSEGKLDDAQAARAALERARGKVQDLRVAKSTFFAAVDPNGKVLRTDQEQDSLAGKNLFTSFPELRGAVSGYVETRGAMAEASEIRGRPDAQWVAGCPVRVGDATKGVYATGWSFSAYAYRLENQLRSTLRSQLKDREKEPLIYVFVIVAGDVYAAPVSPDVNVRAVKERRLLESGTAAQPATLELEIEGREFGLAFLRTEPLGKDVGVAVLRSET
ncbi:MAG TPA: hypothetical protein VFQ61_00280 [Polyangiaceae bacterium]|nr:hypothetical protein [Polyangiaceae bacterium]